VATAADSGWTIQSLPTPALAPNGQLTGVSCATNTDCMAVGVAQNTAGHDMTLTEVWDGARWAGQPTVPIDGAVGTTLTAVSCTSADACTAVGNVLNGANQHQTLAERWNGREWLVQSTPNPGGATDSFLSSVSCSSATACTAVGSLDTSCRSDPDTRRAVEWAELGNPVNSQCEQYCRQRPERCLLYQ
jgi:hypothetical protein